MALSAHVVNRCNLEPEVDSKPSNKQFPYGTRTRGVYSAVRAKICPVKCKLTRAEHQANYRRRQTATAEGAMHFKERQHLYMENYKKRQSEESKERARTASREWQRKNRYVIP